MFFARQEYGRIKTLPLYFMTTTGIEKKELQEAHILRRRERNFTLMNFYPIVRIRDTGRHAISYLASQLLGLKTGTGGITFIERGGKLFAVRDGSIKAYRPIIKGREKCYTFCSAELVREVEKWTGEKVSPEANYLLHRGVDGVHELELIHDGVTQLPPPTHRRRKHTPDLLELEKDRFAASLAKSPTASYRDAILELKVSVERLSMAEAQGEADPMSFAGALACIFECAGRAGITVEDVVQAFAAKFGQLEPSSLIDTLRVLA